MKLVANSSSALRGIAPIPGDKSCSHRALILGALANGTTRITGLLGSDDVLATARAVAALGATVKHVGPGEWQVTGSRWTTPAEPIDCGNSGTAARLLLGACAGVEGLTVTLTGDQSLSKRPMQRVTAPLERMGAKFDGGDHLPITVHGQALGAIHHLNIPASAQVKSALLLAGVTSGAAVSVKEPLASRDHSEIMLGEFGNPLTGCDIAIASDPSSAAFPLVAAAIVPGSEVTVRGLLVNPLRTGLYEVLEQMGGAIALTNEQLQSGEIVADLTLRHAPLQPCHVTAANVPAMIDEIPALAVACAYADGESVIEGLAELRVKESDRLGAIVAGLVACGVAAIADGDALRIFGRGTVRGGGKVVTHGDHRIAMAFLTLGLASEQPVEVDQAEMIATSFPNFVEVMQGLGAHIEEVA
ncbi:MAG: 3-phosphoshikimate 1-carboxyvinyltransferase [Sphingomonas bacterium]|nr:3-phosphoshikimate 1-carboxyvinyltransferase [Sphingomonas bacterium]